MRMMIHVIVLAGMLCAAPPEIGSDQSVAIHGGKATFSVSTNTLGINVRGTSDALDGGVELHRVASGLVLDRVAVRLPVKTLATGMNLRDEHMRKYVFTTPGGGVPDLRFEAEGVSCATASGHQSTCQITGTLAIRDVARSLSVAVKIRQESEAFRVDGDGTVNLHDYGIEPPSQLGVKTANEVQIHLEFTAKPAISTTARAGAAQ
jgi:polyisoprenoid-binding protein YceI